MKTIRIPQGNEFSLFVPLVLAGNDLIDPTQVTELEVMTKQTNGVEVESSVELQDDLAVVSFAELLEKGSYDVLLTGKYSGRQWAIPLNNVFAICSWANDATFARKITPEMVTTDVQPIVGWWVSDTELVELKAQYRSAIAAEQAATDALEQKVAMLDGVAQQGTDETATNTKILYEVTHLVVPPPTGVAQENTLTQGIAYIRNDIAGIDIDTSDLAKQGTNAAATNSAILADIRSRVAQEANATANKEAIIAAIPSVADVQSGLATEANATANKQEILQAIEDNAGVPMLTIPNTTTSQELAPNTCYIFENRSSALILTLGTPIVGIVNEYHFFIVTDSTTAPTVVFPSGITWNGGSAPTIAAGKTYEVSILNNIAAYFEI